MTKQESFKKRVRARMVKTGERYAESRRKLIERAERRAQSSRTWVSEPETSDESLLDATGRGWDEWCDVIEAWPRHEEGHAAIARYVQQEHNVAPWWAQTVTVGYERITGLRLPHQQPDGTFTANKSRTLSVDAVELRNAILDDAGRDDMFPGLDSELRSKPTAKVIRVAIGPGVAQFALDVRDDGRTKVTVSHEKLPASADVDQWKFYWSEWLDAIGAG